MVEVIESGTEHLLSNGYIGVDVEGITQALDVASTVRFQPRNDLHPRDRLIVQRSDARFYAAVQSKTHYSNITYAVVLLLGGRNNLENRFLSQELLVLRATGVAHRPEGGVQDVQVPLTQGDHKVDGVQGRRAFLWRRIAKIA